MFLIELNWFMTDNEQVQQSVFYVDVTSKEQGFCYDVSLYGKYTDGVYLSSVLHEPLASAEEISAVMIYLSYYSLGNKTCKASNC